MCKWSISLCCDVRDKFNIEMNIHAKKYVKFVYGQVVHTAVVYMSTGFRSIKWLDVYLSLFLAGWDASQSQSKPQHYLQVPIYKYNNNGMTAVRA